MRDDRPIRILYIEDDRGMARLTERVLQREGILVDIAETGEEGLQRLRETEYDLLLVDYRMPGMSGLDVLQEVNRGEDPLPVIMVTGGGSEKTAVQAMKLGASDYIVKDIDSGYLELVPVVIEQVLLRHQILQEKKEAEEAREQLILELDAFAHTVAHDLKNPLYGVRLNLARLGEVPPAELTPLAHALDANLKKMSNIIDELLLLATVRQEDVVLEPLDMREIIEEALDRLDYLIRERDAEITLPETFPIALGYPGWIEEVWANYLSNAIKYGGHPPRVEIGFHPPQKGRVTFWVKDNGEGISPKDQEKLFVQFARLNDRDLDFGGHGLGLSIVKRIIDKLDGDTHVQSEPGKGSTFSFTLPLA